MALGRRGGQRAPQWGRQGADLGGGGTVPSQGERAGRGPRGPDHCRGEVARGTGARGLVGGGRRRGRGPHSVPVQPERSGGRGVRACARGSLPGPRRGRPAAVGHPARREAECGGQSKWARGLARGDPGLGTRLRRSSLSAPDPVLLPEPGLRLPAPPPPPRLRRARLPGAPRSPSHHAIGASPPSPPKTAFVVLSLLNRVRRELWRASRDASPGEVRGESCREEARTPGWD